MPPKVRRPAAAPKAGLRRPAARVPRAQGDARWKAAKDSRIEDWPAGRSVVVEGEYWEGAADVCGTVLGATVDGDQRYLRLKGTGTKSEGVLKYLSGSRSRELEVHLCGDPCEARTWKDGLVHARRLRLVEGEKEAWMNNLDEARREAREEEEDANVEMRREEALAREELKRRELKEREAPEQGEASKKKKKKKKESRRVRPSSGKKDLASIYGGTALDPDPAVRKVAIREARKVRRRAKKRKKAKFQQQDLRQRAVPRGAAKRPWTRKYTRASERARGFGKGSQGPWLWGH